MLMKQDLLVQSLFMKKWKLDVLLDILGVCSDLEQEQMTESNMTMVDKNSLMA
jgi:septal ring-binding cell division protein DamX